MLSSAGKALKAAAPVAQMLASSGALGPGAMALNQVVNRFTAPPSAQAAPAVVDLGQYMQPQFQPEPPPMAASGGIMAGGKIFGLSPMVLIGLVAGIVILVLLMR